MIQDTFTEENVVWALSCGGIKAKLEDHPELERGAKAVRVRKYGVDVCIDVSIVLGPTLSNELGLLQFRAVVGFVPKIGVAALFRKLLCTNLVTAGPRFALCDQDNSVCLVDWPEVDTSHWPHDFFRKLDSFVEGVP